MPRTPRSAASPRAAPRAHVAAPAGRGVPPSPRGTAPLRRAAAPPLPAARARHQRLWRWLRFGIITAIWAALGLTIAVLWFARDLPRPESALDATRRPSLTLEDRSGHVFARFGDVVGEPLHLSDMPPYLPEAVVAVEDRRFWHHPGIDPIGMARAAWTDVISGRIVQGGSTITQQVAKNLFLTNARTFRRKVQELLLTIWLDEHFTKRQILEIYLNRVYLGAGAWGVDAAAHVYFGVSARQVTLWQAAVLAGLPRAPSRFNPRVDSAAATVRAKEVLSAMAETGAITETQARAAAARIAFPPPPAIAAGWFADWVAAQAQPELSANTDAILRTTLDTHIQAVAESRLAALLDGPGAAAGVTQGAVVVLDAASGAVRAMVGGRDYRSGSFNRAVEARRQPGSAFKVFTWLSALQRGLTPDSMVLDAPIRIGRWSPADFEHRYLGEITLQEALAQSINTAAVRLLLQAGGPRVVAATAARLGIADRLPDDASLALGTGEVGLLELSAAYAAFFNHGHRVTPYGVDSFAAAHPPVAVIDPEHAAMMARMLAAVVRDGTGRAAAVPGRDVAGKTGTTQDFRDAWFIGVNDGTITGVWLGNDDGRPMRGVMGGGLPARLFHEIAISLR
ncbi:MAG TPA: PBP1A family penicillin-binding protein [Acetobacteraceae bacterium]|nr:PBP1A family penicillin-binding protein [Acetobacteraceae bacterium]